MKDHEDKNSLVERCEQLERALSRLNEIILLPETHTGRTDALIQRFEFSVELFWKVLKLRLREEGISIASPRDAMKEAFALGWLSDAEETWLTMLHDRNLTSHTYHEQLASDIAKRVPVYFTLIQDSFLKAKK